MNDLGADLVIVVPLWRRRRHIARVYESARVATPEAHVLFVVSMEDEEVREACDAFEVEVLMVPGAGGGTGDYARKINAGYRASTEPCIFTGADDIVFDEDWYPPARALLSAGAGVVGTVDKCNPRTEAGVHSTHSLIARWYADHGACMDQDHVIYHEGYEHEYCDDELVQTAVARGAYAHAFDSLVEHYHPIHPSMRVEDDETYQRGRSRTRRSRQTFMLRRRLWGGR